MTDTAAKRCSVVGLMGFSAVVGVPDGTIDQGDRQSLAFTYSGVLAGAPPVVTADPTSALLSALNPAMGSIITSVHDHIGEHK